MSPSLSAPEALALASLPVCTGPSTYQHTYTGKAACWGSAIPRRRRGRHVSVKMGVRGIPWAWERRGQEVLSGCLPLLSNKVGETNNCCLSGSSVTP